MNHIVHMPDLADAQTEHTVLAWRVKVGDWVKVNQPLLEVEIAKGTAEVPCPVAGRILQMHAQQGQSVATGTALATIEAVEDPL